MSIESHLPVFTTPQHQIAFYAGDATTHKQVLTIYNPYEFHVRFRVSCNDCAKYTISAAQGVIKSNHSIDLVVHHKTVCDDHIGISDAIRVELYLSGQGRPAGRKDIAITLLGGVPQERAAAHNLEAERFQDLEPDAGAHGQPRQHPLVRRNGNNVALYITIGFLCLIVLLLPKEGDKSDLPYTLHMSHEQKLCAAFVMGVCMVLICRA